MHIAVDAVGVKHSGGATVLLDFLHAAIEDPRVGRISVFCSPIPARRFALPGSSKVREYEQRLAERSYLHRVLWFEHLLGRHCRQMGVETLLCMSGAGRSPASVPHVTFLQQSLPFSAEYVHMAAPRERLRVAALKRLMRSSSRSARRVIVQTPSMKSWVCRQFGLPEEDQVTTVMPAIKPAAIAKSAARFFGSDEQPGVLYVGSASPHKNVGTVLSGFSALRKAVPKTTLSLTWPSDDPVGQQEAVTCLGHLPPELLSRAYAEATILVMPSLVETVGLPILEAMAAGLPVLAADRPYAHDVAADAAYYFDPLSPEDFVQKASHLLQNAQLRQHLSAEGKRRTELLRRSRPYERMVDIVVHSGSIAA